MLNKIMLGSILALVILVMVLVVINRSLTSKVDLLNSNIETLQVQNKQLVDLSKENERVAQEAILSRDRAEASLELLTEERNSLKKKWSSLNQKLREVVRNDPESRDWDSSVVPGPVFGVLLQAGGIRTEGSSSEGVSP